jgi:hypothetical protein
MGRGGADQPTYAGARGKESRPHRRAFGPPAEKVIIFFFFFFLLFFICLFSKMSQIKFSKPK